MTSIPNNDVIDMHVVAQLISHKRLGLSAFERLIPMFLEEAQMLIDQMRCAVAASDSEGLRLTAHKLKGSASVIGALELRSLSQNIMTQSGTGVLPGAEQIAGLESALHRFDTAATDIIRK